MSNAIDLYEATVADLTAHLDNGRCTAVDLVTAYLARIEETNTQGPCLRAMISVNEHAKEIAAQLDAERSKDQKRGPLHGIPIVLKDNINTRSEDGMPTTAGSYALMECKAPGDALVVERLKEAGAIILGKANMTEWACLRGDLPNGWSAVGGQSLNPWATTCRGDPAGSSSGSALVTTVGLAAASVGSQTYGSIVMPASWENVVGLKPTLGTIPTSGVVPLSTSFDCLGPLTKTVEDAATLFNVLSANKEDWKLTGTSLQGIRLGVPLNLLETPREVELKLGRQVFRKALDALRTLGAEIVEFDDMKLVSLQTVNDFAIRVAGDFKTDIEAYLKTVSGPGNRIKNLQDLINFTKNDKRETPTGYEGIQRWEELQRDWSYHDPKQNSTTQQIARLLIQQAQESIDDVLARHNVSALLDPTDCMFADLAGYPCLSVPMGFSDPIEEDLKTYVKTTTQDQVYYDFKGQPLGLMIYSTKHTEKQLLEVAYAYEQKTHHRQSRRVTEVNLPETQIQPSA